LVSFKKYYIIPKDYIIKLYYIIPSNIEWLLLKKYKAK